MTNRGSELSGEVGPPLLQPFTGRPVRSSHERRSLEGPQAVHCWAKGLLSALAVVLTMGLGIGVAGAIFSIVDAVLRQPCLLATPRGS